MPGPPKRRPNPRDYTITWICILDIEFIAAISMLDKEHERLPGHFSDPGIYSVGQLEHNNIIIGRPVKAGVENARKMVKHLGDSFPNVRVALLVGIGGGVPTQTAAGVLRLGDIVLSRSTSQLPGVVQWDNDTTARLSFPAAPPGLLEAAEEVSRRTRNNPKQNPILTNCARIDTTHSRLGRFKYPGAETDILYQPEYAHAGTRKVPCRQGGRCDPSKIVHRPRDGRDTGASPVIHWGKIASGNAVMKNSTWRDQLAQQHGIIWFEMEAAGVMTRLPCLVIRGVSDYCDSHKNDEWQGYAASVAVGFAREVCLNYHG